MDLAIEDATAWSEAIFGSIELGDKRLTKRLMQMGKQLSSLPGSSLSESCEGQDALLEGTCNDTFYLIIKDTKIKLDSIINKSVNPEIKPDAPISDRAGWYKIDKENKSYLCIQSALTESGDGSSLT